MKHSVFNGSHEHLFKYSKKKIKNNKERRLFDLDPSKLYDLKKKKKYYLISLREIRFYKLNFHRREIFRLTHCLL